MLDRQAILGCEDFEVRELEIPEWGGSLFIRTMRGIDRDSWEWEQGQAIREGRTPENIRATLAVRCICDKDGVLLFTKSDAPALGNKSGAVLDRIWSAARSLNHISDEDVEELEKNSETPQADASDLG
jgi:hypothetical protein